MYIWAANQAKLQRAFALSKEKSEEEIKTIYISIGGLVLSNKEVVEEVKDVIVEEPIVESVEIKKKKGRPAKNAK